MECSRVWSLNKRTEEVHRYLCIHFGKPRPSEVVGKKPKTRGPPREPSIACQCGAAFSISCERPARGGHKACRLQLPTSGGPSLLEFAQQHKKSLWTIRSKKLEHNPRCAKLLAGPARCLHKAGRQTLLRLVQANPSAQCGTASMVPPPTPPVLSARPSTPGSRGLLQECIPVHNAGN